MATLRAVLFDLDDTLTDRSRSIERLAGRFLDRFGVDLGGCELHEVIRVIHGGDRGGYAAREELGAHLQSSLRWRQAPGAERLVDFWRDNFPRCNVERNGVTSTLQTLHQKGLKLGVISNGFTASQNTKLDAMGIRPLFSVVLISQEVGISKPDPRIFQMGLEKLGVLASEAIFVGDNPVVDVAGSRKVGIRSIWLNCRGGQAPETVPCPETIASIDQLLDLCEG
ncbi:MAG: HAD family hydrolase [Tepidisphaeraceae bacterium]|jgi:putative hydrolase of the HAD superfamily